MCGIGGILRTDGKPIPEEWLDAIDARIAYRGPDGCGRFRDRVEIDDPNASGDAGGKRVVEVAFVHRRLSIIDHADGHQPMVSERGRNDKEGLVAVVFNGCIYNHRELRRELQTKGHKFVTDHSDTEVLIHGWREWGQDIIDQLEGMYAFAVWDRASPRLFVARDRFGEKPFYLHQIGQVLRFSSSLPAVVQTRSLQKADVQKYLQIGYLPLGIVGCGQRASLVEQLDSGFGISINGQQDRAFANPVPLGGNDRMTSPGDFALLLEGAVQSRLEADVPLGCFLSGGIDSSLVACFAKTHKSDLMTFCVRMPDARFDESKYAAEAAHRLGTNHLTLEASPNPVDDLQFLIKLLGQPFGDSSILPTYWVSKAVRQHAKVALSGDGGDELFVGYERYLAARPLARYRKWLARLPLSGLARAHPKSRLNKAARLVQAARDFDDLGLMSLETIFGVEELSELQGFDEGDAVWIEPDDGEDPLQALREGDISQYLPNDLLRKVDTASMACALEVRCPFLDRDLARAALSMPIDQLIPGGQRKGLLRNIARKYLPKEIVDRPKMGFAIPIGEWFRSDYGRMKTLLLDHLNSAEPFGPNQLNRKAVQRFIDEHMAGKRDHGQRLFTLLTLSIWARQSTSMERAAATQ